MSIPNKMPLTIRKAKDDEFDVIGKLHASAFAENPVYNILFSKMGPSVALQWLWIDGAKQWMAKGLDTVLVLERTDTGEMVGVARYNKYNDGFKPALWDDSEVLYPEGFNKEENSRMAVPIVHWQQELMAKYGQFLCKDQILSHWLEVNHRRGDLITLYSIVLQDFVIAPAHQKRGLGTTFMLEIVALAKEEGMNIALTAGPGMCSSFHKPTALLNITPHA